MFIYVLKMRYHSKAAHGKNGYFDLLAHLFESVPELVYKVVFKQFFCFGQF